MKRGASFAAAFLAVVLASPAVSRGADHADGIKTALDGSADITDVYSFTDPKDPERLVLIMNVHPFAHKLTMFSDAVDYKFRIREIADAKTLTPSTKEQTITCTFQGGSVFSQNQEATCAFDVGGQHETLSFETRTPEYRAGGSGKRGDLQAFAGVRSDTWFVDLVRIISLNKGHSIGSGPGKNGLQNKNVLSIVVALDKRRVGGPLLAVSAQTVRK